MPPPPDIRRTLAALDAEAAALLIRYRAQGKLPAWVGYYRYRKPGAEVFDVEWASGRRLAAVRRGHLPTIDGHKPLLSAIIDDPARLDPKARHIMRLWLATVAKRRAQEALRKAADADRKRAHADHKQAQRIESYLREHLPSLDRRADNLAERNVARQAELAPLIAEARAEAARFRKSHPDATKVAEHVKALLGLKQHVRTVRRWLIE